MRDLVRELLKHELQLRLSTFSAEMGDFPMEDSECSASVITYLRDCRDIANAIHDLAHAPKEPHIADMGQIDPFPPNGDYIDPNGLGDYR
jgi:hypothetical protein